MLDFIANVAQHVQVTLACGPASFHFRSMDCARETIMQQVMETVLHVVVDHVYSVLGLFVMRIINNVYIYIY